MTTINDKNLKNAIANVIVNNYMNQKVDFGSDEFVVENFKIKFRKAAIRKAEFDDYGVDPNTDHFCVVEFWNATKEEDVFQAVCVILTICNDETIGTAGVPYDFDIEGTEDDFDIKFADQVMAEL
jgi:hypothetical protein